MPTPINELKVRRKSATPSSGTSSAGPANEVSKLVDIDLCIGCKACEVACKEWNELEAEETFNFGSYQSHEDLTANTWDLMRFAEVDLDNGDLAWLIRKDSCMHCDEPGCLLACPAPGAIVQYENGIVDFDQTKCIGCQYCIAGCPFDIPRFDSSTKKVYKCTMCSDRVADGMEPACVKACPTGSIRFGTKEEMLAYGETKVAKLQGRGFEEATLYDPSGVGGLHMMYVVPRGEMLGDYGLPANPEVKGNVSFTGGMRWLRRVGAVGLWAGAIGGFLYWLRTGRQPVPAEGAAVAEAERIGAERAAAQREAEAAEEAPPGEAAGGETREPVESGGDAPRLDPATEDDVSGREDER